MQLSQTAPAQQWLEQFDRSWRPDAVELVDAICMVGHDLFFERMRDAIVERAGERSGPIGLYAERERRKFKGVPNRLFRETRGTHKRAIGPGPAPVQSTKTINPEVGSEGLLASLVTALCREQPGRFISHPGPDQIRDEAVRALLVVTDFVGTGSRMGAYLESAWRIGSVRSWHSRKQLEFEVIAYSATEHGLTRVRAHRSRPLVAFVQSCPTLKTMFSSAQLKRIEELCVRHDPVKRDPVESLGYGGLGTLVAFAHGCPNNAPRLLHRGRSGKWHPLFPRRATSAANKALRGVAGRLRKLDTKSAGSPWIGRVSQESEPMLALLSALKLGPRLDEALAARTGMTCPEIRSLVRIASAYGWLGKDRRLNDSGRAQLVHANFQRKGYGELLLIDPAPYFPTSLRTPR